MDKQFYFTFKGIFKRIRQEYEYYTKRPWTLKDVGNFWDSVEDYDDINEELYTYFRRFTDSYQLAEPYLEKDKYKMLDIQARSGKGSLYWYEKNRITDSTVVDFSPYLNSLADRRLKNCGLKYQNVMIEDFPLPFADESFDLVCSYETIEHVYDYRTFFKELVRVLSLDGLLVLTCPNVSWEIVHWTAAAININHSEGPHRFLKRQELLGCIKENNLSILAETTTIVLPFNKKWSIRINEWLEKYLPEKILSLIALRRIFILKKK